MQYDDAVYTEHAQIKMARRDITSDQVRSVLLGPDSDHLVRPGRRVIQGRIPWGNPPRMYLLRVFLDVDRRPAEIVTVYLTGKFAKYEAKS